MNYTEKQILIELLRVVPLNSNLTIYSFNSNFEKLIKDISKNSNDDYFIKLNEKNKIFLIDLAIKCNVEYMITHMYFEDENKNKIFECYDSFSIIVISKDFPLNEFLNNIVNLERGVISTEW